MIYDIMPGEVRALVPRPREVVLLWGLASCVPVGNRHALETYQGAVRRRRRLGRFTLNIGAREEVYRGLRRQFSPSVTGGVWISPKLRLRGGASHAFRLPSFTELYYHDPANIGSPSLKPEQAWSSEAGAEWRPVGRILAQTTVFDRRERNDIDYVRASAGDVWRATNFRRLRVTGVEASLHVPLPGRES